MLSTALRAAKAAGKVVMEQYGTAQTLFKGDGFGTGNIVTQADLDSERVIVKIIKEEFPEHNIFAEEEAREDNGSAYTWYIDPIDGTSNFSRNIPLFGISIGLVKDTQPIVGVLFFPALDLLVHAEHGKGAFANDKRVRVSQRALHKALYYGHGYHEGEMLIHKQIIDHVGIVKVVDASSFELAQIALGDAELYILPTSIHDVAAGAVIVREAGGIVSDYQGNPWTTASAGIVASNNVIHSDVIALLRRANLL